MPPIFSLLSTLIPSLVDKFFPSDTPELAEKKLALQAEIVKAVMDSADEQNKVNAVEASSANIFVAGWRPFIGWMCGVGLALTALAPLINLITVKCGLGMMPHIDNSELNSILMGMLGLGGLRTVEKVNGVKDSAVKLRR